MPTIEVYTQSGQLTAANMADQTWGPFGTALARRGFALAGAPSVADALVSVNLLGPWAAKPRTSTRQILVQWESPAVQPALFRPRITRHFPLVIPLSPLWPGASQSNWVRWPQGQDWSDASFMGLPSWEQREDAVALINRNVVSANPATTYYLRRQAASIGLPRSVRLTGYGWPTAWRRDVSDAARAVARELRHRRPPSLRVIGATLASRPKRASPGVESKVEFLAQFRFALIIENSLDYVSEKLFGALAAGCVPIYVGPPLQPFGLDENLVVRAHPSVEGIRKAIATASNDDVERTLSARRSFLHEGLDPWLPANTMAALANRVCDFLEDQGIPS